MGKTTKEKISEAQARATFVVEKGIDLDNRRLYAGAQSAEHNPDFDVGFMLLRDMSVGIHTLQTQFKPDKDRGQDENKPIEIFLSTFGGDLYTCFGIYDQLCVSPVPIHVYVFGPCMSAGTIIMQGAEKRFVSRNSRLMLHYGSTWDEGTSYPRRIDEVRREHHAIMNQVVETYMSRCNKKVLAERRAKKVIQDLTKGFHVSQEVQEKLLQNYDVDILAEEMIREDILPIETYWGAKECIELGLADEIVERPPSKEPPILSEN